MTSFELRKKFLEFFIKRDHKLIPSSSLIPQNDPSLLFVNAGMNQFKDVFLGLKPPPAKNAITIQKCLRAGGKHNDLEAVGETPFHHTFFEMMGNFSFGDYFKKQAIALAWEFLTKELGIPEEHLYVSVHTKDKESYQIWKNEQNIPAHKIYQLGDEDNFWQMGETGPCGFCSEIYYFNGTTKPKEPEQMTEIWNLVFMEFYDKASGQREKLPVPCVDTGMGLERLCSVLQNKKSNYHTDLFETTIKELEKESACNYDFTEQNQTEQQKAFRVLADHSRAVSFLIADGVYPGNTGASYVLRRIMRRALYYSQKLHSKENLLQVGVNQTIALMEEWGKLLNTNKNLSNIASVYLSLKENDWDIREMIERETKSFSESLRDGKKQLEKEMQVLHGKIIPARTVWNLYSTYGFPIDLTGLVAKEKGWAVASNEEVDRYKKRMEKAIKTGIENIDFKEDKKELTRDTIAYLKSENIEETKSSCYEKDKDKAKLLAVGRYEQLVIEEGSANEEAGGPKFKTLKTKPVFGSAKAGSKALVVLDKTCFYPEGGGPIGDQGFLKTDTGIAKVLDCQKEGSFIIHEIKVSKGEITEDQDCEMEVYENFRKEIKAHHTATHLLNSALREVLGNSVKQKGSLIEPYFLRFDFSHPQALTQKQITEVENLILKHIYQAEEVSPSYKTFKEAQKENYIYLQGENYPEQVRVLKIGKEISKELCGGVHVKNSSEIDSFKIIKEEGLGLGIRRITAYTSLSLKAWEDFLVRQNHELRDFLKLTKHDDFKKRKGQDSIFWEGVVEKENPFLQILQQKEKELKFLKQRAVRLETKSLEKNSEFKISPKIQAKANFHPLAQQTLSLREFLKLPLPVIKKTHDFKSFEFLEGVSQREANNLCIDFFKNKNQEIQSLKDLLQKIKTQNLDMESLGKKIKELNVKNLKTKWLFLLLPFEDRKILSDLSDSVLSQLNLSGLLLFGESQTNKHPVFIKLNKKISGILSAGDILKNDVAPFLKGKGGGKASFAQGSVQDITKIQDLSNILISKWSKN